MKQSAVYTLLLLAVGVSVGCSGDGSSGDDASNAGSSGSGDCDNACGDNCCTEDQLCNGNLVCEDRPAGDDKEAPAEVTGLAATARDGAVVIAWTDPPDGDFESVELTCTPDGEPVTVAKGVRFATVTSLKNGTAYKCTVVTIDSSGNRSEGKTVSATPAADDSFWVAPNHPCYDWGEVEPKDVPWEHLTHLALGYLWPQLQDGSYTAVAPPGYYGGWETWSVDARAFVEAGHAAGRKVFNMLGGAGSNEDDFAGVWNAATADGEIDAFVSNLVAVYRDDIGFDGIELDWEEDIEPERLVTLAQKLRAAWPEAIITIDTFPMGDDIEGLAPAADAVDAFMPMTFLDIPQWGGWVLPIPLTPLYSYGDNGYSVDDNLQMWLDAGVPASKVIMGVGGFGTVWGDSNDDGRGPIAPYSSDSDGEAEGETRSLGGDNVVSWPWVKALIDGGKFIEGWDDVGKCSYWHTASPTSTVGAFKYRDVPIEATLIFYETPRSMAAKIDYAKAQEMRGMNFWTLAQLMDGASSPVLETAAP